MEIQMGSRKTSKLGLVLVLLGVAAATYTVMAVSDTSVGDLIPRSLELADEEKHGEGSEGHEDHADEPQDDNKDVDDHEHHKRHHKHHHCHKIGKIVVHVLVIFFALFGLGSCVRLSCRRLSRCRRRRQYNQFEGHQHHIGYHPQQEMRQYVQPQPAVPVQGGNRYPNFAPYGQPVNV